MQFPVPKNIDLEDKIIGPLTLKQFLYLAVGGSFAYAIIKKGNSQLAFLLAIPIILFSLALAFIKIQERPFAEFLGSFFTFLAKPRQRIWQKHEGPKDVIVEEQKQVTEEKVVKKNFSVQQVSDLTKILDSEDKNEGMK